MSGLVSFKTFRTKPKILFGASELVALRFLQANRVRDLLPPVVNHAYYKVSITKGVLSSYVSYGDLFL